MPTSMQTVRGATRLAFDLIGSVTNTVEQAHETIARRPLPWSSRPQEPSRAHGSLSAAIYATIRGVNNTLRDGIDQSLAILSASDTQSRQSGTELALRASLNGAFGDYLEAKDNPLAIPMCFTTPVQILDITAAGLQSALPKASPHIALLVHGLCLSDYSWSRHDNADIGSLLAQQLDLTPVYLRYNSGRHISTNGQELAVLLERLVSAWPVAVQSLTLVGHSMGGLVIRSACWYAKKRQCAWLEQLRRIICIGTPHHGSPVEKAGHLLTLALKTSQYIDHLALGDHRSAGIKDLRHGNLLDEDWQDQNHDVITTDPRHIVPLLPGIDYYFIAASVGRHDDDPRGHLLGDFLVRQDSAFGAHPDKLRQLQVPPQNCRIFHEKNHFDLLSDHAVHEQILAWVSD